MSTPDQSPELQLDDLRAAAHQRGWTVVAELVDVGSGGRSDLPGRAQALDLAHRGLADVVAVWRLDRLGRSVRDLVTATDLLARAGVELLTLRDAIDTATPAGRMVFHVLAAVAELERELIGDRVRAGLARARRRGASLGRPRVTVDVLRARGLLANGLSVREVARRMKVARRTLVRALDRAGVERNPLSASEAQPAGIRTDADPEIDGAQSDGFAPGEESGS